MTKEGPHEATPTVMHVAHLDARNVLSSGVCPFLHVFEVFGRTPGVGIEPEPGVSPHTEHEQIARGAIDENVPEELVLLEGGLARVRVYESLDGRAHPVEFGPVGVYELGHS